MMTRKEVPPPRVDCMEARVSPILTCFIFILLPLQSQPQSHPPYSTAHHGPPTIARPFSDATGTYIHHRGRTHRDRPLFQHEQDPPRLGASSPSLLLFSFFCMANVDGGRAYTDRSIHRGAPQSPSGSHSPSNGKRNAGLSPRIGYPPVRPSGTRLCCFGR